jgi:hypothetical protein
MVSVLNKSRLSQPTNLLTSGSVSERTKSFLSERTRIWKYFPKGCQEVPLTRSSDPLAGGLLIAYPAASEELLPEIVDNQIKMSEVLLLILFHFLPT